MMWPGVPLPKPDFDKNEAGSQYTLTSLVLVHYVRPTIEIVGVHGVCAC